jgi:rubredoxin
MKSVGSRFIATSCGYHFDEAELSRKLSEQPYRLISSPRAIDFARDRIFLASAIVLTMEPKKKTDSSPGKQFTKIEERFL